MFRRFGIWTLSWIFGCAAFLSFSVKLRCQNPIFSNDITETTHPFSSLELIENSWELGISLPSPRKNIEEARRRHEVPCVCVRVCEVPRVSMFLSRVGGVRTKQANTRWLGYHISMARQKDGIISQKEMKVRKVGNQKNPSASAKPLFHPQIKSSFHPPFSHAAR